MLRLALVLAWKGLLVLAVSSPGWASSPQGTGTFQWPVDNPVLPPNQGYWACNSTTMYPYHTGLDLSSATGSLAVRAAAPGIVRVISMSNNPPTNHGLGNVIIIDHNNKKGPFSLYAHLSQILVSNGQFVGQGAQIGVMGNTGTNPPSGIHLHFELKHWGVLGNLSDNSGPYYGYVPASPNLHGYLNPRPYLDYSLVEYSPNPIGVTALAPWGERGDTLVIHRYRPAGRLGRISA